MSKERRENLLAARRFIRAAQVRVKDEMKQIGEYDLAASECDVSLARASDFADEMIENQELEEGGI